MFFTIIQLQILFQMKEDQLQEDQVDEDDREEQKPHYFFHPAAVAFMEGKIDDSRQPFKLNIARSTLLGKPIMNANQIFLTLTALISKRENSVLDYPGGRRPADAERIFA